MIRAVSPSSAAGSGGAASSPTYDERRVLADEAHLDVPLGQLAADLERSLAEGVEQAQAR